MTTLSFRAPQGAEYLYAACLNSAGKCIARPFVPGQVAAVTFRDDPVTYSVAASTRSPEMEIVNPPTYANFLLADFPIFRKALLENLPDKRDNRSKLSGATSVIRVKESDYYAISIPRKGQDPHGVVIPSKWQWPTETTSITNAYPQFAAWAHDIKNPTYKNWYMSPEAGKVVNK